MRQTITKRKLPKQLACTRLRLRLAAPRDAQRHRRILQRGEFSQQMVELEYEADVPVAKCGQGVLGQRGKVGFSDSDGAGVEPIEPAEQMQQRALANA